MARRKRDYRAEEARRNELARQRGFATRAQQRGKIERGEIRAIQPKRVRAAKTVRAQKAWTARAKSLVSSFGDMGPDFEVTDYLKGIDFKFLEPGERCIEWSNLHAANNIVKFDPDNRPEGVSLERYTDVYFRAFVDGPEAYGKVRGSRETTYTGEGEDRVAHYHYDGGSDVMYEWFVEIQDWEPGDYDDHYSLGSSTD